MPSWNTSHVDTSHVDDTMAAKCKTLQNPLLPGYIDSPHDEETKARYRTKLDSIPGVDLYEIPRNE